MTLGDVLLRGIKKLQRSLANKYPQERKNITALQDENLIAISNKIQTITAVCHNELHATLQGHHGWSHKIKTARQDFHSTGSEEQKQLSNHTLHQINTQVLSATKDKTQEVEHYFFARHLQSFFNNGDNWVAWQRQLKDDTAKLKTLAFLKKQWFS